MQLSLLFVFIDSTSDHFDTKDRSKSAEPSGPTDRPTVHILLTYVRLCIVKYVACLKGGGGQEGI